MAHRLLYVVRHGETDWNAAQRWQGQTDVPLNDHGRSQARAVAHSLRAAGVCGVVASDLSRAQETARIVASELGVSIRYLDVELRERSFGCFEGMTREECERLQPEAWRRWLDDRHVPDGAETHDALNTRVVSAIARAARLVAGDDAPALVVTHGGTLRAIVEAATGKRPPPVKNGEVWRVGWDSGLVWATAM